MSNEDPVSEDIQPIADDDVYQTPPVGTPLKLPIRMIVFGLLLIAVVGMFALGIGNSKDNLRRV